MKKEAAGKFDVHPIIIIIRGELRKGSFAPDSNLPPIKRNHSGLNSIAIKQSGKGNDDDNDAFSERRTGDKENG